MDEEWNYVIDKLRKYLEELRLREREHFLIYNWGFISPKGIKFCPLDTPVTNETTFGDFLSFIQANELFVYIAYLFLIKTIDEKRRPALMELKRELDESSKHLKLKLEY